MTKLFIEEVKNVQTDKQTAGTQQVISKAHFELTAQVS